MENRQRLFCSSISSSRMDPRHCMNYFPPTPNISGNGWIRASSSSPSTKLLPTRDEHLNNHQSSWLNTPSSPVLTNSRPRYIPKFASIHPVKSHSPNYFPLMQANLQKDTTYTKIFVGGLPYHTTDETLRAFFSKFGEIEEAVVINDRNTGKSRGYGFVTMAQREDAEKAVSDPNPTIDGRRANVNLAFIGAKNRAPAFPLAYNLFGRMPTYQSTAAAYSSNVLYYPLAQQSTLQQPIYVAPGGTAGGTTWPTNFFSPINLTSLTAAATSNVSPTINGGTASPQTVFEIPTTLFDPNGLATGAPTLATNAQTAYWPPLN